MSINSPCFCGSALDFHQCCQPFITLVTLPKTPEQLMRSRFSAYAMGDAQYVFDTYAKNSQSSQTIKEISEWGSSCKWLALKIHSTNEPVALTTDNAEQFVEFSAFYVNQGYLYELREKSRFILETDMNKAVHWRYLDGDIIEHCEKEEVKRKDLCPCNKFSTAWTIKKGKKFKQCCGK